MKYVYVASSWRNPWQPAVVRALREVGLEVYDFRNPEPGNDGFRWTDIDPEWKTWAAAPYRQALQHPIAEHGFGLDMGALRGCDACILVQPCGNSAHLELGWAAGAGKVTAVLFPHGVPLTPIGGHSVSGSRPCAVCGNTIGCRLPGRLAKVEPELMAKMADEILVDADELQRWGVALTRKAQVSRMLDVVRYLPEDGGSDGA